MSRNGCGASLTVGHDANAALLSRSRIGDPSRRRRVRRKPDARGRPPRHRRRGRGARCGSRGCRRCREPVVGVGSGVGVGVGDGAGLGVSGVGCGRGAVATRAPGEWDWWPRRRGTARGDWGWPPVSAVFRGYRRGASPVSRQRRPPPPPASQVPPAATASRIAANANRAGFMRWRFAALQRRAESRVREYPP